MWSNDEGSHAVGGEVETQFISDGEKDSVRPLLTHWQMMWMARMTPAAKKGLFINARLWVFVVSWI